jgi:hypothetical protein
MALFLLRKIHLLLIDISGKGNPLRAGRTKTPDKRRTGRGEREFHHKGARRNTKEGRETSFIIFCAFCTPFAWAAALWQNS